MFRLLKIKLKTPILIIFFGGILTGVVSCKTANAEQSAHDKSKVRINLRLPEEKIRSVIFAYTPTGSSTNEVFEFVQKRLKHKDDLIYETRGVVLFGKKKPGESWRNREMKEVGESNINVWLGDYGFNPFLRTGVYVSWAFDETNKLVDVVVEKETDGL